MPGKEEKMLEKLSDLPNYKVSFSKPMAAMGITSIAGLKDALMDDSRAKSLIEDVVGIGPKTIESWRSVLLEGPGRQPSGEGQHEVVGGSDVLSVEQVEPSVPEGRVTPRGRSQGRPSTDDEQSEEDAEEIKTTPPEYASGEHNVNCGIDDGYEIRQILIDLLQWNGAKKKGLASTIDYVKNRLKNANLTVSTIEDEDADPIALIASKGNGGLVLWGHLDTAPYGDMEGYLQGVAALDFIYGRGAVDMKGALASLLLAAQRMASWEVPFTIILTTDGLKEQAGAQTVANDPMVVGSKGVLILAPTSMIPAYGQAGYIAMNVTIASEDSIIDMSKFLYSISQSKPLLPDRQWLRVGLIRGGKRKDPFGSVVSCQATLELLTAHPTSDAIRMIEDALANTNHLIEIQKRIEPLGLNPESTLVEEVEDFIGKKALLCEVSTEAGHLAPSIPSICMCGPGNSLQTRTVNEYVVLTDLEKTFEMILTLVDRSGSFPTSMEK